VKKAEYEWVVEVPYEQTLKLSDALRAVGGPTSHASLIHASVVRLTADEQFVSVPVDMARLWRSGDADADLELQPGDVVRIPSVDPYAEKVELEGQIAGFAEGERRTFLLIRGMKASTLLAYAGGPTPIASLAHAEIHRPTQSGTLARIPVDLQNSDGELQPRDTLYVPSAEKYQPTIRIVGEFLYSDLTFKSASTPATSDQNGTQSIGGDKYLLQPFLEGETVGDVLRSLSGPLPTVNRREVRLIRQKDDGTEETIEVDVNKVWDKGAKEADVKLQAGDTLVLPAIRQHVYVLGAVSRPGPYAMRTGYTLADYIGGAGGMLPQARERDLKVISKNPDGSARMDHVNMLKGARNAKADLTLQPGDIIVVPRSEISGLRDVMTIVGQAATAFFTWDRIVTK
jgi:protein involved in polysaccharide export with SLBB domain